MRANVTVPACIPQTVIDVATGGDPIAKQMILRHYRGYIDKLATCTLYDEYGNIYYAINPDIRDELENAFITGILHFDTAA